MLRLGVGKRCGCKADKAGAPLHLALKGAGECFRGYGPSREDNNASPMNQGRDKGRLKQVSRTVVDKGTRQRKGGPEGQAETDEWKGSDAVPC